MTANLLLFFATGCDSPETASNDNFTDEVKTKTIPTQILRGGQGDATLRTKPSIENGIRDVPSRDSSDGDNEVFLRNKSVVDKYVLKWSTSIKIESPLKRHVIDVNLAERTTLENVKAMGEYFFVSLGGDSQDDFCVFFHGRLTEPGNSTAWARWNIKYGKVSSRILGFSKEAADILYISRFPEDWQVLGTGVQEGFAVYVIYRDRRDLRLYEANVFPTREVLKHDLKVKYVGKRRGYQRIDEKLETLVPTSTGLEIHNRFRTDGILKFPPIASLKPASRQYLSSLPRQQASNPKSIDYSSVTPRLDVADDGQHFAFQPSETSIATVNLQSGEIINTEEYDAPIRHFHFNKDNLLAAQTIEALHPLTAFSSNGKLVVTLLSEDKLGVLDITQGKVISQSDLHGEVEGIRISPSNTMALLAYKDVLHLISWAGDGSVLKLTELEAYSGENVTSFAFSRDSKILAIANTSSEIHLVSTHDGVIENTITGFNTANCMTFLSGNDVLLVGQINGNIVQHTISTNASVQLSNQFAGSPITNMVTNPEETKCILVQENGNVNVLAINNDN